MPTSETTSETTSWRLIHGAAAGVKDDRERFAELYEPLIRAYFAARWKTSPDAADVDDTTQDACAALPDAQLRGFADLWADVARTLADVDTR